MIINLPRSKPGAVSPIPRAYRPWLLASLVLLVGSLFTLTILAAIAFIYYANVLAPLWLTILGSLAGAGVALGFGGLFLMLVIAGYRSFKEDKGASVAHQPHENTPPQERP